MGPGSGVTPRKDLGPESGNLTGVPPPPGVNRVKTLPCPILRMRAAKIGCDDKCLHPIEQFLHSDMPSNEVQSFFFCGLTTAGVLRHI